MEMERFEKAVVNTPVTTLLHRTAASRALKQAAARAPLAGPVLEVGCGQGALTPALLRFVPADGYVALDFDATQVARAARRLGSRVAVEEGDVTRLRFADAAFGTVTEFNMLHHVPDPAAGVREIFRVLRPGGRFVFTDYSGYFFRGPVRALFPPESRFTPHDFTRFLLDAGFDKVRVTGRFMFHGDATKPA